MHKCLNCKNELDGRRKKVYCSLKCQAEKRKEVALSAWLRKELAGWVGEAVAIKPFVRRYMIDKSGGKCSRCGWNEPHPLSNVPPLEIHHIDGNAKNSWEENLTVLCPNCHSLTSNFRSRNANGNRRRRKTASIV